MKHNNIESLEPLSMMDLPLLEDIDLCIYENSVERNLISTCKIMRKNNFPVLRHCWIANNCIKDGDYIHLFDMKKL